MATAWGSGKGRLSAGMTEGRTTYGTAVGPSFTLTFTPDTKQIAMAFSGWAKLLDDWRPAFADIVRIFHKHEKRHLRTSGSSTGGKFARLSPPYRAWKAKNYPGRQILVLRGALRSALVHGGPGTAGLVEIGRHRVRMGIREGTDVGRYALAHQEGNPARNLPRRPPIRYDPTFDPKAWGDVGTGGTVPFGGAVAQIFQVYIVRARKRAKASKLFKKQYDWRKMRRGVLRLKTR